MRVALSLRVKRVWTAAEVPELDASRRRSAWITWTSEYGYYLVLYVSRCRILNKVAYLAPANGNTAIVYCPLNHLPLTVSLIKSH